MNNTTSASDRLANYRAAQAARAASVRYATYQVLHNGRRIAEVNFPSDTSNANFAGLCFYNPVTDSFLGDTEVDGYFIKRVA